MAGVSPKRALAALLAVQAFLAAAWMVAVLAGRGVSPALLDLDGERNLPTAFSSAQLLAVGLLALALRSERPPGALSGTVPVSGLVWAVVASGFVYLSADEWFEIHERIRKRGRVPVWILVFAPFAAVFAGWTLRGFLRQNVEPRLPRLAAAGFGLMALGGFVAEWIGFHLSGVSKGLEILAEECLEMSGASVMLFALLDYRRSLRARAGAVSSPPPGAPVSIRASAGGLPLKTRNR
jgi:hypothetical protein